MQPYTHPLVGALLGTLLCPHDNLAIAACFCGASCPDVVMAPQWLKEKARGKKPLVKISKEAAVAIEISHSLILWIIATGLSMLLPWTWLPAFLIGGVSHVVIDSVSHADEKYLAGVLETGFIWPLPWKIGRFVGFWTYRHGPGDMRPKPIEIIIDVVLIISIILCSN